VGADGGGNRSAAMTLTVIARSREFQCCGAGFEPNSNKT